MDLKDESSSSVYDGGKAKTQASSCISEDFSNPHPCIKSSNTSSRELDELINVTVNNISPKFETKNLPLQVCEPKEEVQSTILPFGNAEVLSDEEEFLGFENCKLLDSHLAEDNHENVPKVSERRPVLVIKKLPSWINIHQRVKVNSNMHLEPVLNYFSNNGSVGNANINFGSLNERISFAGSQNDDKLSQSKRLTRSRGEEIKVDFNAILPDYRHVKPKKSGLCREEQFYGFKEPNGILCIPDHYLVYKKIMDFCRDENNQSVENALGAGNLHLQNYQIYFMGDDSPIISGFEQQKYSSEKVTSVINSENSDEIFWHKYMSVKYQNCSSYKSTDKSLTLPVVSELSNNVNSDKCSNTNESKMCESVHEASFDKDKSESETISSNLDSSSEFKTKQYVIYKASECANDFCRLGCVCKSLRWKQKVRGHCGHEECMFSGNCCRGTSECFDRKKLHLLDDFKLPPPEQDIIPNKRKRKAPKRLLEEEMIYDRDIDKAISSFCSMKKPKIQKKASDCSVLLNRLPLYGTNARCLNHFQIKCACMNTNFCSKPLPRNVALKSTAQKFQRYPYITVKSLSTLQAIPSQEKYFEDHPLSMAGKTTSKSLPRLLSISKNQASLIQNSTSSPLNLSHVERTEVCCLKGYFDNYKEFQRIITSNKIKCSDLIYLCKNVLITLPKNSVILMKISVLDELMRMKLANMWSRRDQKGEIQILLTETQVQPEYDCIKIESLNGLSNLPNEIRDIFPLKSINNLDITCSVLTSHDLYWEISGFINLKKYTPKKTLDGTSSTSSYKNVILKSLLLQSEMKNVASDSEKFKCNQLKVTKPVFNEQESFQSQPKNETKKFRECCSYDKCPTNPNGWQQRKELNHSERNYENSIWYWLDLNQVDELCVEGTSFKATKAQLASAIQIAKDTNHTVRLVFDSLSEDGSGFWDHGIYACPKNDDMLIIVGPFLQGECTKVKTFIKVSGKIISTMALHQTSNIIINGEDILSVQAIESIDNVKNASIRIRNAGDKPLDACSKTLTSEAPGTDSNLESNIISQDEDTTLSIKIADVQGNWSGFDEISSVDEPKNDLLTSEELIEEISDDELLEINPLESDHTDSVSDGYQESEETPYYYYKDPAFMDNNSLEEPSNSRQPYENGGMALFGELTSEKMVFRPSTSCQIQRDIVISDKIELGYLVPDIPRIQPVPVSKGGIRNAEHNTITMKHPFLNSNETLHFVDLPSADFFLNQEIRKRVNLYPDMMKINWSFVNVREIQNKMECGGFMPLSDLTKKMFLTCRGVFPYDKLTLTQYKKYGISKNDMHRVLEAKRRKEIISAKDKLVSLLHIDKSSSQIRVIKEACYEIKTLEETSKMLKDILRAEGSKKSKLKNLHRTLSKAPMASKKS